MYPEFQQYIYPTRREMKFTSDWYPNTITNEPGKKFKVYKMSVNYPPNEYIRYLILSG